MADTLSAQRKEIEKKLQSSPTAYGTGTAPSSSDISLSKQLARIKARETGARDLEIQKNWYEDEAAKNKGKVLSAEELAPRKKPQGVINRALHGLGLPLYGIVGGVEAALGKGTKKGLANIKANMEEGGTFGDLLRQYGASGPTALAGGLALDIALDPINWVTFGSQALVPRIFTGATKGGVEGLTSALKMTGLNFAKAVTKPADFISIPKVVQARSALKTAASEAKEGYRAATGWTAEKFLGDPGVIKNASDMVFSKMADANPELAGKFASYFKYSPQDYFKRLVERTEKAVKYQELGGARGWLGHEAKKGVVSKIVKEDRAKFPTMTTMADADGTLRDTYRLEGTPQEMTQQLSDLMRDRFGVMPTETDVLAMAKEELEAMMKGPSTFAKVRTENTLDEARDLMTSLSSEAKNFDHDQLKNLLTNEFLDDLTIKVRAKELKDAGVSMEEARSILRELKDFAQPETGWKAFDDAARKFSQMWIVKDKLKGEQIMKGYRAFIDMFKTTKIGQLSSTALAMLNNAVMTNMYGINIADPGFLREMKSGIGAALKALGTGETSVSLMQLMNHPEFKELAEVYPDVFYAVFKIRPDLLTNPQAGFHEVMTKYLREMEMPTLNTVELESLREQAKKELLLNLEKRGIISGNELETTYISQELGSASYWKDMMSAAKEAADDGKLWGKALDYVFNKPVSLFEATDQSYKLGLAAHLVKNGITEKELTILKRFNPVQYGVDVFHDTGTDRWKFSGLKAADVASDVYMNYAAMPTAVKVMRSMPLVGMPFASFAYAMLAKTGQTALYNPAFFNKAQFLINELNGGRSPLEKDALNSPYYSWMKENGMVSIPFFRDSPVYINMAAFFSHMTMNIFEPSERRTEDTVGGAIVKIIDSIPLLKTPEGQLVTDYFIVPILLRDTNPTGIFDQPLYPQDATIAQKAGYFARSLGETVFPANLAGLGLVTPEVALPYIPSYKYRKVGYAVKGKTPVGKSTKESRVTATERAILSAYAGIGLYPLNIKYNQ